MARRTAKATPAEENLVEVTAEPYTDDENWDGVPDVSETVETAENTEVAKKRPGSPLLQATRDYEREHKRAEKARKAYAKYAPLIDDKDAAEEAEAEALGRLTTLLNRTNDAEGDGADE